MIVADERYEPMILWICIALRNRNEHSKISENSWKFLRLFSSRPRRRPRPWCQDQDNDHDPGSNSKTKTKTFKIGPRGVSRPRPALEDYITGKIVLNIYTHNIKSILSIDYDSQHKCDAISTLYCFGYKAIITWKQIYFLLQIRPWMHADYFP